MLIVKLTSSAIPWRKTSGAIKESPQRVSITIAQTVGARDWEEGVEEGEDIKWQEVAGIAVYFNVD